jgi:hypothetical protein
MKLFKPVTIKEAFEFALHVEDALESQSRRFKYAPKGSPAVVPNLLKIAPEMSTPQLHKPSPVQPSKALIELEELWDNVLNVERGIFLDTSVG